jgi:CubicO group peptidase (beta-lactamase class C family)
MKPAVSLVLALLAMAHVAPAQAPSTAQFRAAVEYATRTDAQALLVMHRGAVVHEQYMSGASANTRIMLASGSKSFVGVATIAAAADGLLRLDDRVAQHLPEWAGDPRKSRVTIRQLLSLESGVAPGGAATGCGGPRAGWNDAVSAPSEAEPGTRFAYGPYPFITMGALLERLRPAERFEDYLVRRILGPLGVQVEWRAKCADGKPQLAGGAAMTARDWATFGEFIRLGGVHKGQRLLPDSLVRQLFTPSTVSAAYGLSWWLSGGTTAQAPGLGGEATDRPVLRRLARRRGAPAAPADARVVPSDLVMAAGAGKQRLYLIPSRELVVVRLGPLRGGREFDDVAFLRALLGEPTR